MGIPDKFELQKQFESHAVRRAGIVKDLIERIESILSSHDTQLTVTGRLKTFDSYYKKFRKYLKRNVKTPVKLRKYILGNPDIPHLPDIMGIRVICPFIDDLGKVEKLIISKMALLQIEHKGKYHKYNEFSYESDHLLVEIPRDILDKWGDTDFNIAEIQIRTHMQNAWAEVEHELLYKIEFTPCDYPMRRKFAAIKASLSLADTIFHEIRGYQKALNKQLKERRSSFFDKIENASDAFLDSDAAPEPAAAAAVQASNSIEFGYVPGSMDDLLLLALAAHNNNDFDRAIEICSQIINMKPEPNIKSVIFQHRGMAYFAQSKYEKAIDDFTYVTKLNKKAYKAYYYRGVVQSVLQNYTLAIDDFTRALEISPYHTFCLFRRGQAYYHQGDYPQAMSDCDAALALAPNNDRIIKFKELLTHKLKI